MVARGTAESMRLRERSRRSERRRALIIRSPSACRSSSLTSCLLIRWSRRHKIRDQARSAAATVSVATRTEAIALTDRSSTRCGSMPGSMSIAVSRTTFWPISIIIATAITAVSLMMLFRNSVQPRAPNTRLRPLRSEMREASGKILSGTMRGGLWATEARTPAAVRRTAFGARGNDEYQHEEGRGQRGEERRLAGKSDFATLDRIVEPLFRWLFGFVLGVDVVA